MEIIIGFLIAMVAMQEYRIHRLIERMLLQANIPQLTPARVAPPRTDPAEVLDTRKKLFTVTVPG